MYQVKNGCVGWFWSSPGILWQEYNSVLTGKNANILYWCSQRLGYKEFTYFNINKSEIQSPEANCQEIQCQIHFFIKIFFSGLFFSRLQTFFQKTFLWNQQHSTHSFTHWLWQIVWNGLQKTRLRVYFCLQNEDEQYTLSF